ncbi:hypothetical protein MSG28_001173 [Choristoneura fumiferana]|uniref:Uncharacterized protein n=1 Tax=Choristoneura fumiferana TaxID=7141 RepID=A0ACC0K4Q4_CHOFU|nr:hypothetical protein MSG28_001173 [Choristoneura fumiferana]
MSHINDLIGIVRGLRLVVEAGAKLQQESSRLIWNNSSIKAFAQNCPTNPVANYKPNPDFGKELLDRALVVAHGFRQYAVMNVPNFNTESETKADMDPRMKEEIEELNREFNRTFESLEKSQSKEIPSVLNAEAPLERVVESMRKLSENSKARVVPSSRLGRMFSFGSLAAGLGVGTVAQYARNTLQSVTGREEAPNAFLSPANAERIVDTLCKVREFMDQYIEIIKAASDGDRAAILRMSKEMKFLTGYESKVSDG